MKILQDLVIESGRDIWPLLIALTAGCLCGAVALRLKSPDRTLLGTVLAPVPAVAGVFVYLVGSDLLYGSHSDSAYAAVLVQSLARGCLILPWAFLVSAPISIVASILTQCAFRATLARQR